MLSRVAAGGGSGSGSTCSRLCPPSPWPAQLQRCRSCQRRWRRSNGSACGAGGGASPGPPAPPEGGDAEAWALMGRVVSSDRLVLGAAPRQRLVLLAAARQAGLTPEEMQQRLQELATLLPDVASLLPSLHPATLARLGADTSGVARKLVELRVLFPSADISQMVSRRPTLLLDEEFCQVEEARDKLLARLALSPGPPGGGGGAGGRNLLGTTGGAEPAAGAAEARPGSGAPAGEPRAPLPPSPVLDGLVSRQPLLLVRDVDVLLDELERLMPGTSLLALLQSNPSLLFAVQRGSAALGPGAEFMG